MFHCIENKTVIAVITIFMCVFEREQVMWIRQITAILTRTPTYKLHACAPFK